MIKINAESSGMYQPLFSNGCLVYGDWIYERIYHDVTQADNNDLRAEISYDLEDAILLLRLFKPGDLVLINHRIKEPDSRILSQFPYRIMSDFPPCKRFLMNEEECTHFDSFCSELKQHQNWSSNWFQIARRFFLYGSGKEFNPLINEVDRVVDFMIAMESILVPEKDFVGSRLRERAVSLLNSHNIDHSSTKLILRDFYKVRSSIAHGSDISSFKNGVLKKNIEFETIIRKVMIEAVKALPADDGNRKDFLKRLFDVSDQKRSDQVFQDFCKIKNETERRKCSARISKRL